MKWPLEGLLFFALAVAALQFRDDHNLVQRLKNREHQVMDEVYDQYGKVTYTLVLRIVKDRQVAEDLVQETFLRVWTRAHILDLHRGGLGPWILTVARNQAIDYIRSAQGRVLPNMIEATDQNVFTGAHWEGDLLQDFQLQQVKRAIDKLGDNQRLAIELAYFEGLSQSEMAERMQQPLGTVKTWVRTALQALREELNAPVQV